MKSWLLPGAIGAAIGAALWGLYDVFGRHSISPDWGAAGAWANAIILAVASWVAWASYKASKAESQVDRTIKLLDEFGSLKLADALRNITPFSAPAEAKAENTRIVEQHGRMLQEYLHFRANPGAAIPKEWPNQLKEVNNKFTTLSDNTWILFNYFANANALIRNGHANSELFYDRMNTVILTAYYLISGAMEVPGSPFRAWAKPINLFLDDAKNAYIAQGSNDPNLLAVEKVPELDDGPTQAPAPALAQVRPTSSER